ncbi:30S ribosomal protein S20 [Erysipelotrichaceae bacterium OH741_COT-311]|nr:30S ribosomal protein S20 [Erysipelotrichaceae bacterium OH741_COT-311]
MANIKSQKKRAITNAKRNVTNTAAKSELKSAIKKVLEAVATNNAENAKVAFDHANSLLDKALTSKIKHSNYVSRMKSRLAKAVDSVK